ncbi:hypothetical protein AU193_06385 [Mycobacterium sp. GA-1285]|uniref:hypothetical protein n=1 Tax=Mycobacterium sp. GA-1285 TaxID=1772282 RepID=UPI000747381C|nr:hypothetical protein [Mycobacterium sp. GA-1285]KUI20763.1 hypothetical protein AU193_06385 [Mycobacterium sp. GA-1285]
MAEHESGQWNVAAKDDLVYLERANDSGELLFGDSLEPHEARQLARALTKFADKLDEGGRSSDRKESDDSDRSDDDADDSDRSDDDDAADSDRSDDDDDDSDRSDDDDDDNDSADREKSSS